MPKQSSLQNVRLSMGRELVSVRYLFPFFDRQFVTRYLVMDMGEDKIVIVDAARMSKIGEDIQIQVTPSDVPMLETASPVIFYGALHLDPWKSLGRTKGPEEMRKGLLSSNLLGRKAGSQKVSDIVFNDSLMSVTAFELKTMGILRKEVPVGDILFNQDGTIGLRQK